MQPVWRRRVAIGAVALVGWVGACSDRASTEPKFERPIGIIIGLDQTKRLTGRGELGGNQAMAQISSRVGDATLDSPDSLLRTVAEWRATQGVVSGRPAAKSMWEGVEEYDGDYFVWSGGESYAPIHKQARIYNLVSRASRIGDGPVDFTVTFKFDGHRASNDAQWTLTRSNGDAMSSRPYGNFGSQTDPFLGLTMFGARGWAASASEHADGCDVKVTGETRPKAWYEGGWSINGVSFGVNPSGASGQINFSLGKRNEFETSGSFNTQFTCPPPDSGGGGYGGGGGGDCTYCQQWFLPVGEDWIVEWWECGPASPTECEQDEM